jgi:PIN domain nuclease of toxin-antitoxin system
VLIDTHIWLWIAAGEPRRVGPRTRRGIERARTRGELYVSVASIFEIAALQVAGRLDLSTTAENWVRDSIETSELKLLELTASIAIDAGAIPAAALSDPCDRFLVASARWHALPFVTRDQRIIEYAGHARTVRVTDARS